MRLQRLRWVQLILSLERVIALYNKNTDAARKVTNSSHRISSTNEDSDNDDRALYPRQGSRCTSCFDEDTGEAIDNSIIVPSGINTWSSSSFLATAESNLAASTRSIPPAGATTDDQDSWIGIVETTDPTVRFSWPRRGSSAGTASPLRTSVERSSLARMSTYPRVGAIPHSRTSTVESSSASTRIPTYETNYGNEFRLVSRKFPAAHHMRTVSRGQPLQYGLGVHLRDWLYDVRAACHEVVDMNDYSLLEPMDFISPGYPVAGTRRVWYFAHLDRGTRLSVWDNVGQWLSMCADRETVDADVHVGDSPFWLWALNLNDPRLPTPWMMTSAYMFDGYARIQPVKDTRTLAKMEFIAISGTTFREAWRTSGFPGLSRDLQPSILTTSRILPSSRPRPD